MLLIFIGVGFLWIIGEQLLLCCGVALHSSSVDPAHTPVTKPIKVHRLHRVQIKGIKRPSAAPDKEGIETRDSAMRDDAPYSH
jgi:hypothetical protein